jgi:hypothetical protein
MYARFQQTSRNRGTKDEKGEAPYYLFGVSLSCANRYAKGMVSFIVNLGQGRPT